jgi:hypothetical protein
MRHQVSPMGHLPLAPRSLRPSHVVQMDHLGRISRLRACGDAVVGRTIAAAACRVA